jgi:hypothetical protein
VEFKVRYCTRRQCRCHACPGSSANSRIPAAISTAASSSSTPATPAHRGQPRSTAHCSHRSPNQLSRPLLVLPSPQSPSNFNQSTFADDRRPPPPPAHRGQLTPSLPAPPQPLSQHYINHVKIYDPLRWLPSALHRLPDARRRLPPPPPPLSSPVTPNPKRMCGRTNSNYTGSST